MPNRSRAKEFAALAVPEDHGDHAVDPVEEVQPVALVEVQQHLAAEKLTYLGLHALQHRGQESAGSSARTG